MRYDCLEPVIVCCHSGANIVPHPNPLLKEREFLRTDTGSGKWRYLPGFILNDEECDATEDDSIAVVGNIKKGLIIFIIEFLSVV
jgi:hypothetical protein